MKRFYKQDQRHEITFADPKVKSDLKKIAQKENRSLNNLIIYILNNYLSRKNASKYGGK